MGIQLKLLVGVTFLSVLSVITIKSWANENITIASDLTDYQVFQRNEVNVADISFAGSCQFSVSGKIQVRVLDNRTVLDGFDWQDVGTFTEKHWQGKLEKVPVGGPYRIEIRLQRKNEQVLASTALTNILVGDLWILAGQSNIRASETCKLPNRPVSTLTCTDTMKAGLSLQNRCIGC